MRNFRLLPVRFRRLAQVVVCDYVTACGDTALRQLMLLSPLSPLAAGTAKEKRPSVGGGVCTSEGPMRNDDWPKWAEPVADRLMCYGQ